MIIKNISNQTITENNCVIGPGEVLTVSENIGKMFLQKHQGSVQMLLDSNINLSNQSLLNGSNTNFNGNLLNESTRIRG